MVAQRKLRDKQEIETGKCQSNQFKSIRIRIDCSRDNVKPQTKRFELDERLMISIGIKKTKLWHV